MKIISGNLKGRNIKGFKLSNTRPTMDRVKESIFSIIGNNIEESICLDLFSGSGNLGIEAISRKSKLVYFVDNNIRAIKIIKENLNNFNITNGIVIKEDYKKALLYFKKKNITFDIIFLDPPYNLDLLDSILEDINNLNLLNDNGIIICEYNKTILKENYNNIILKTTKKYGDTKVNIYQKLAMK
ncbi:MAG: 16S rRNA (guanine(966)-N(2))-methyltransferase RsmD [Bacilli bacterium]